MKLQESNIFADGSFQRRAVPILVELGIGSIPSFKQQPGLEVAAELKMGDGSTFSRGRDWRVLPSGAEIRHGLAYGTLCTSCDRYSEKNAASRIGSENPALRFAR